MSADEALKYAERCAMLTNDQTNEGRPMTPEAALMAVVLDDFCWFVANRPGDTPTVRQMSDWLEDFKNQLSLDKRVKDLQRRVKDFQQARRGGGGTGSSGLAPHDERSVIADALVNLRVHVFLSDADEHAEVDAGVIAAMKLLRPLITDDDWKAAANRAAPSRIDWAEADR